MFCPYSGLSDFHDNWEKLVCTDIEHKFLLSTNWELIHQLLEEIRLQGKNIDVPERNENSLEIGYFQQWKSRLKQSLLTLLDSDFQELINKYIQKIFSNPNSKLNYKLIHPEEIRNKNKLYPTLSGARSIYSFLNRKLEILPLFSGTKESNKEVYFGWPLKKLENEEQHTYSPEWISQLEKDSPDLFDCPDFKEPEIPDSQISSKNKK